MIVLENSNETRKSKVKRPQSIRRDVVVLLVFLLVSIEELVCERTTKKMVASSLVVVS